MIQIPQSFYQEETRLGYTVSIQMKKVWAIELDLLSKILDVCKKHEIKIYASGGTLLGAIRHNGFIPWDDDIDLMMFREDYVKLCEVAETEFEYPYFFQTNETDPGSLRGHAQLRNSETTGILMKEKEWNFQFNQGIFIDIFPLDSVLPDNIKYDKLAKKVKLQKKLGLYYGMFTSRYTKYSPNKMFQIGKTVLHFFHILFGNKKNNPFYEKFEKLCVKNNTFVNSQMVTSLCLDATILRHQKFRSDFENPIEVDFEFLKIPVQGNYEHALNQEYGDWKKIVKGSSCHGGVFFDPDKPYTEYIKR